jgi:hypothetical protein
MSSTTESLSSPCSEEHLKRLNSVLNANSEQGAMFIKEDLLDNVSTGSTEREQRGESPGETVGAARSHGTIRAAVVSPSPTPSRLKPAKHQASAEKKNPKKENVGTYCKSSKNPLRPLSHKRSRKLASMSLRKMPTDVLLTPPPNFDSYSSANDEEQYEASDGMPEGYMSRGDTNTSTDVGNGSAAMGVGCWHPRHWVHIHCLSPKYKLKTQLMLSFGSVNFATILMVIAVCILVTFLAGESVKEINSNAFTNQLVPDIQALTVRYLAESLERQVMPFDLIDIMEEATQDRLQGYPDSLFANEASQHVPFKDVVTGLNIYPIVGDPMFLDWQIPQDVTDENFQEHVQDSRWHAFYKYQPAVSTTSAVYIFPGICHPNVTDPTSSLYWPNCTMVNNNISTGGVVQPVPSAEPLFRASNDLIPLIKAIFESKEEIRDLGLYFASMGAGASFNFPAFPYRTQSTYISIGCNWMSAPNPINPSLGPIGTPEEIQRCHPFGESVSRRVYNPLERPWCRDQALNPQKTMLDIAMDTWNPGHWLLFMGRAIYDRETSAFVACTYIDIQLTLVEEKLKESLVTANSALTLIRFDTVGTVVASTAMETRFGRTDPHIKTIDQLEVGVSLASYRSLFSLVDYDVGEVWDPKLIRMKYETFSVVDEDFLVSVYPMPRVPDDYDPNYKPEFLVVMSTFKNDVFVGVDVVNELVDHHVRKQICFALAAGAIGLFATMMILVSMSNTVTAPLRYINQAADDIVNSFGESKEADVGTSNELFSNNDESTAARGSIQVTEQRNSSDQQPNSRNNRITPKSFRTFCCTPKTELTDVLNEFNKMVASFSGGLLAKSEQGTRIEIRNPFALRNEFADLYASRKVSSFAYNLDDVQSTGDEDSGTGRHNFRKFGFVHIGSNLNVPASTGEHSAAKGHRETKAFMEKSKRGCSSRLFLWTVALIVTPLLLTSISISSTVYYTATEEFELSVDFAKGYYLDVRLAALSVHAKLRADYVASLVDVSVRDLYLLTRYSGWLVFGGVKRADSFTEIMNGLEECKPYADDPSQCPYIKRNFVCNCARNDAIGECTNASSDGSRPWQRTQVLAQRTDALPDGDRNFSSYPRASTSVETTMWWDDIQAVPGWEKGSNASGYDTLYDRLRVSSAMPLFPVLDNYNHREQYIGQYITFEADGTNIGYRGCDPEGFVESVAWKSTEENGAAALRPELCPLGKIGYDPR